MQLVAAYSRTGLILLCCIALFTSCVAHKEVAVRPSDIRIAVSEVPYQPLYCTITVVWKNKTAQPFYFPTIEEEEPQLRQTHDGSRILFRNLCSDPLSDVKFVSLVRINPGSKLTFSTVVAKADWLPQDTRLMLCYPPHASRLAMRKEGAWNMHASDYYRDLVLLQWPLDSCIIR